MAIQSTLALIPSSLSSSSSAKSTLFRSIPSNVRPSVTVRFQDGGVSSIPVGGDLPHDYDNWFPKRDPKSRRRAGILLHPTSFPGPYGIGDLGSQSFEFLDWLHEAGCSLWQVVKFTFFLFSFFILS